MGGVFAFWRIHAQKQRQIYAKKLLQKATESGNHEPLTLHPEVDPAKCAGCGTCTQVCPEGDILKLINHKAVLVAPTKCVGHGACEASCPMGAIQLVFGTKTRGMDIPRLTKNYETNVPGLYIAGELGGMGLIRNAIKQGRLAAEHALKNSQPSNEKVDADILVVGGGPAGLAAGLAAIAAGKRYMILEQNSFGGTVYNFPRQKIVMTHPADLPVVGKMKFQSNKVSKEELLQYWTRVREKSGLKLREGVRFESLTNQNGTFHVTTSQGVIKARKVILAMGVRGSPRKLGLPNEDLPKVTYNLLEPEQYQGRKIAVVGGGNAALEAAQYLANPKLGNKVTVLVRGTDFDRANEENIKKIRNLMASGGVQVFFSTSVNNIGVYSLGIDKSGSKEELENEFLFVFAGAEMPFKFLMSLGIQIDKKFGQAS